MKTTKNFVPRASLANTLSALFASVMIGAGLSACGGASLESLADSSGGAEGTGGEGVSGFQQQLAALAGVDAVSCGNVELQQSSETTDTCVSESFSSGSAFYALYNRAGIDSTVADGVTMDASGVLHLLAYDSSITGQGDNGPARITKTRCDLPRYTGASSQSVAESFQCFVSLDQFQTQIQIQAEADAVFCGKVESGLPTQSVDQCVSDSFSSGNAFYAVYVLQGIDSTVAEGVSGTSGGGIDFWSYDSSVTGQGDDGPSDVRKTACNNPVYIGGTGQSIASKFQCGAPTGQLFESQQGLIQYFDGSSYKSLEQYEVGETATSDLAMGYWFIDFAGNTFHWSYSDVIEVGTYSYIDGASFSADLSARSLIVEVEGDEIIWNSRKYRKIAGE